MEAKLPTSDPVTFKLSPEGHSDEVMRPRQPQERLPQSCRHETWDLELFHFHQQGRGRWSLQNDHAGSSCCELCSPCVSGPVLRAGHQLFRCFPRHSRGAGSVIIIPVLQVPQVRFLKVKEGTKGHVPGSLPHSATGKGTQGRRTYTQARNEDPILVHTHASNCRGKLAAFISLPICLNGKTESWENSERTASLQTLHPKCCLSEDK